MVDPGGLWFVLLGIVVILLAPRLARGRRGQRWFVRGSEAENDRLDTVGYRILGVFLIVFGILAVMGITHSGVVPESRNANHYRGR